MTFGNNDEDLLMELSDLAAELARLIIRDDDNHFDFNIGSDTLDRAKEVLKLIQGMNV